VTVIHKLINSIWNKEELSNQWKDSIIVPILKKGDETDCNNYLEISLLLPSLNIISNIILSLSSPYIIDIIGGNQCRF
jgi:hypothetical protein